MGWNKLESRKPHLETASSKPFELNESCFIRKDHHCGKVFGASKSCFIACPSDDSIEPIIEIISEKLTKVGIEPIVAIRERAYGQDIFCTKICGKIIESKFCIVILDDAIIESQNVPNPNVYYEYGLMTSMNKHIIPLQKDDLELAFNIQSYDTIKYNNRNLVRELDIAIKDATRSTDYAKKQEKTKLSERSIFRAMEVAGFNEKNEKWVLSDAIDDTDFIGFSNPTSEYYIYLGKLDREDEISSFLEDLYVVLHRTERIHGELKQRLISSEEELKELKESQEEERKRASKGTVRIRSLRLGGNTMDTLIGTIDTRKSILRQMESMTIGFIINQDLDSTEFIENVQEIINEYSRFSLAYTVSDEIKFGDDKVQLTCIPNR